MTIIVTENLKRVFKTTTGVLHRKKKEIIALDGVDLTIE